MSNKIEYISYGNAVSGENYSSGVEALAENVIEDNDQDAVIIFPAKNKFATPRSESYRITTENAEMILPYPIYKIKRVLIKPNDFTLSWGTGSASWTQKLSKFTNEVGDKIELIDITDFIVSSTIWKELPNASSKQEYLENLCKDNTFYGKKILIKLQFYQLFIK